MSAHSRLPDEYSKRAKHMCNSANLSGSSWRERSSNATNEKPPSSKRQESSRFLDKSEESGPFAQPYIDRHNESIRQTDDGHVIKQTSRRSQKQQVCSKVNTETDIVRHMKNLPSYLHPVEKPKTIQDRALNVGVLDWRRLEKWRDSERLPKKDESRASSRFNSLPMASETSAPSKLPRVKKHRSVDLRINLPLEETKSNHAQHSQEKAKNVRDSQYSGTVSGKHIELSQKMKFSSSSLEDKNDVGKRVERNQKMTLQNEDLSQSSVKSGFTLPSVPISEQQGKKSRHDDCIKHRPEHSADEPQDIVLLVPKLSRRSFSKNRNLEESKISLDEKLAEKIQKSHSCRYGDEIPLRFPFPDNASTSNGLRSDVYTSDFQNGTRRSSDMKNTNLNHSVSAEAPDETDFGTAAVKSRPQSPSRRFSFNLGKIGRSFSFRETSTVSKDNSKYTDAKSGPISSESLPGIIDHNREKTHSNSIGWSSSFRKILNPVLKPKPAHSSQASHSNLVVPEPTGSNKLHRASNFQALVQFDFKNRLPFFRFVAGNSSDILTASIKDLPTKTGGKFSYSFHSVTEVKKKSSSWIGHGGKDKKCSFDHTALCQMKISASRSSNMVIEYVLYGVRVGEVDEGDPEVLLNREIAAIILEQPSGLAYDSESEECKNIEWNPFLPVDTENCDAITVILPGDIHGMPNEGTPSSLIDRWRSGGVCDCGGWDMGCKLRVLIDLKERTDSLSSTNICSLIDQVISKRDKEGRKQPIFSVAPFKDGYYSVHFDQSISQLEAFAICVAVLTNQRLSDILDVNLFLETNTSVVNNKNIDNRNIFHSQVPAKYFSSPPASPVGRI